MAMTARQKAECVEQFGDDLAKLCAAFDRDCNRMRPFEERINWIAHQEHLGDIAKAFQVLGEIMSRDCDHAEEAEDRRSANPLEPGFRRIG